MSAFATVLAAWFGANRLSIGLSTVQLAHIIASAGRMMYSILFFLFGILLSSLFLLGLIVLTFDMGFCSAGAGKLDEGIFRVVFDDADLRGRPGLGRETGRLLVWRVDLKSEFAFDFNVTAF
jgi:hypothetical protein